MDLAVSNWSEINGLMLLQTGRSAHDLVLPELLDVVYAWAVKDATTESKAEFDQRLTMPPAGTEVEPDDGMWSDEAMFRQFMQASQAPRGP